MSDMKLNDLFTDDELKEMFRERAKVEAEAIISRVARRVMEAHAKEIAEREIEKVVADALAGKVEVDDGWGERKSFESLQHMLKSHLAKEMKGYALTKALDAEVRKQVTKLIEANIKELATRLVAELTEKA